MCACVCVFERAVLARAGRGPLCRSLSSLLTPAPPLFPHTSLYTSSTDTLNNAFARLWWGKVAYNDGTNPNVTQMWNLMFSNHTVSLTGAAYVADSSWLTNDGRPSVMLDYTDTNNIAFREMYDEMRYMANGVWLGRIWWGIPTNSFRKTSYTKLGEVKDRAVLAALNATAVHASVWGSLVGESSRAEVTMDGKFPLGWFAMQCAGPQVRKKGRRGERDERERERERVRAGEASALSHPHPSPTTSPFFHSRLQAVPKLRYSAWAEWDVVRDLHHGYVAADYRLPSLNGKEGAGAGAVSGPGYPNTGNAERAAKMGRWHIWPGKLSNVDSLGNFTQLQPYEKEVPLMRDDKWAVRFFFFFGRGQGAHRPRARARARAPFRPPARSLSLTPSPAPPPPPPHPLSLSLSHTHTHTHTDGHLPVRRLEGRLPRHPRVRVGPDQGGGAQAGGRPPHPGRVPGHGPGRQKVAGRQLP